MPQHTSEMMLSCFAEQLVLFKESENLPKRRWWQLGAIIVISYCFSKKMVK
jgi:hypothetical protein